MLVSSGGKLYMYMPSEALNNEKVSELLLPEWGMQRIARSGSRSRLTADLPLVCHAEAAAVVSEDVSRKLVSAGLLNLTTGTLCRFSF